MTDSVWNEDHPRYEVFSTYSLSLYRLISCIRPSDEAGFLTTSLILHDLLYSKVSGAFVLLLTHCRSCWDQGVKKVKKNKDLFTLYSW